MAFVNAMILMGVMMLTSASIFFLAKIIDRQSGVPRIKSQMSAIEGKVRAALMQPTSYQNCKSDQASAGRVTCSLRQDVLTTLSLPMLGIPCPTGTSASDCGILIRASDIVENKNFMNPVSGELTTRISVKIKYTGTNFSLKDILADVDIPADILQAAQYTCPSSAPIFKGFSSTGVPNCSPFDIDCTPGSYLTNIDKKTLQFKKPDGSRACQDLPSPYTCADNLHFIDQFKWDGGAAFTFKCNADRVNPYTFFSFDPNAYVVYAP